MSDRVCIESDCDTRLASLNSSRRCWLHGGWDGREFGDAIRAFLSAIEAARLQPRPPEPSLVAMRRWQRKWGKHTEEAAEEIAA